MVNVEKLYAEAATTNYSHMVIVPTDIMWLCEEILRLRGTPIELKETAPTDKMWEPEKPAITPPVDVDISSADLAEVLSEKEAAIIEHPTDQPTEKPQEE